MLKAALLATALIGLFLSPVLAEEQEMTAEDDGQIVFVTPSGNIGCIYTPEGGTDTYQPADGGPEISCDRIEPSYVHISMGPDGEVTRIDDPGEQGCCGADQVFAYGNEASFPGFICYSETTGLVCETDDSEHGFLVSKAKIHDW